MTNALTILVVEDDEIDLSVFRQFVKRTELPWAYVVATSVREGRQRLAEQSFDVVFTDLNLPDGTAFDLFHVIGDQVAILITGGGDEEVAVRALKSGFSDYLIKRMDRSHLRELPAKIEIARRQLQTRIDLRESEARLRDLFDSTDTLIHSVSPDGSILFVNPAWCRALGYTQSEAVGLKIFNLIHESCRARCGTIFERLMQGEDQNEIEVTFVAKDGHRVELEGRMGVRRKDGQIVSTRGVFIDISSRRAQDQQLKLLKSCLARVEDIVMITEAEPFEQPGPRIVYVNDAFERVTGYTREEALGKTPRILYGPDTDRTELRRVGTALRKWETVTATLLNYKKDGTKFWNEMTIAPVADPSGWFTHWVAVERDVTSRKATEEELSRLSSDLELRVQQRSGELTASEARFQQLAGAIDDVFWLTDPNKTRMLYVSPAYERIWGKTCQSLVESPQTWFDAVYADDREAVRKAASLNQSTGKYDIEYRIVRADGQLRWIRDRAFVVKDADGNVAKIAGIASDITQAKLMQQQVLRSQRVDSIGSLAGGVAHDLNNALAPILMANELLKKAYPDAAKHVRMIEASANRCAAMVSQMLVFARGYEGVKADMNPNRALAELAGIIEGTFPKGIEFINHAATDLATISADPTQFHQVLLNLCVNARDAMEGGGLLQLEAENVEIDSTYAAGYSDAKPGKYVTIRVKDSGSGIPPEVIAKIFDPFFTTKPPDKGTGLGLSTVAGILRGHGGFIRVYSTPGEGSLFAVYFPVADAHSRATSESRAPFPSANPFGKYQGHGESVLVVDDEPIMREIATEVLESLGFSVTVAIDGTDALMKVAEKRDVLKLVITDLHMPHLDGLGFVRVLRRMAPEVKILVTSGRMETSSLAEFESLGVTHFLTKPFNQKKLVSALQELIPRVPPARPGTD
jgi:PAS domain S-box-containing protein